MRRLCLSLPGATSDFPFDEATEAFRVRGRIFALHFGGQPRPIEVNLKCDPGLAADLRAAYAGIRPGWHMSHEHWNTVVFDGDVPDDKLEWLIRHSYERVLAGLPKAERAALGGLAPGGLARRGAGKGPR